MNTFCSFVIVRDSTAAKIRLFIDIKKTKSTLETLAHMVF